MFGIDDIDGNLPFSMFEVYAVISSLAFFTKVGRDGMHVSLGIFQSRLALPLRKESMANCSGKFHSNCHFFRVVQPQLIALMHDLLLSLQIYQGVR